MVKRNWAVYEADQAMSMARQVCSAAQRAAAQTEDVATHCPEFTEQYRALGEQFWAMLDVAREAEHRLAELHAQVRQQHSQD